MMQQLLHFFSKVSNLRIKGRVTSWFWFICFHVLGPPQQWNWSLSELLQVIETTKLRNKSDCVVAIMEGACHGFFKMWLRSADCVHEAEVSMSQWPLPIQDFHVRLSVVCVDYSVSLLESKLPEQIVVVMDMEGIASVHRQKVCSLSGNLCE